MARKKQINYFQSFCAMGQRAVNAAQLLHETMSSFELETFMDRIALMHKIENEADAFRHEVLEAVAREFITPIEREDIVHLLDRLDDVVDAIEDVMIRVHICNIIKMRPDAAPIAALVLRCAQSLMAGLEKLENFRKQDINEDIVAVNALEDEGDRMYLRAMGELYRQDNANPIEVFAWSQVYDQLELCCDKMEQAAEIMGTIILKNS
jgi:predicted phosphate transport protein (TIGR00153 family)